MNTKHGILAIEMEELIVTKRAHRTDGDKASFCVTADEVDLIITVARAFTFNGTGSVALVIELPGEKVWHEGGGLHDDELAAVTCFARALLEANDYPNNFCLTYSDGDPEYQYFKASAVR